MFEINRNEISIGVKYLDLVVQMKLISWNDLNQVQSFSINSTS